MDLNDYSSRFLTELLREFPEFTGRARAGEEVGCFTVELAASTGSILWISTEEFGRITVGSDAHHVHFGGWADSVDARDFADAVARIRRLLSGESSI
ncbi:MAG: hypothetical protein JWO31_2466 [Phycisphaerales bacterium]|nr:hypothetical protein [Phycisphaerales bacterium]